MEIEVNERCLYTLLFVYDKIIIAGAQVERVYDQKSCWMILQNGAWKTIWITPSIGALETNVSVLQVQKSVPT